MGGARRGGAGQDGGEAGRSGESERKIFNKTDIKKKRQVGGDETHINLAKGRRGWGVPPHLNTCGNENCLTSAGCRGRRSVPGVGVLAFCITCCAKDRCSQPPTPSHHTSSSASVDGASPGSPPHLIFSPSPTF